VNFRARRTRKPTREQEGRYIIEKREQQINFEMDECTNYHDRYIEAMTRAPVQTIKIITSVRRIHEHNTPFYIDRMILENEDWRTNTVEVEHKEQHRTQHKQRTNTNQPRRPTTTNNHEEEKQYQFERMLQ